MKSHPNHPLLSHFDSRRKLSTGQNNKSRARLCAAEEFGECLRREGGYAGFAFIQAKCVNVRFDAPSQKRMMFEHHPKQIA